MTITDHDTAATRIGNHLADRDSFILVTKPGCELWAARQLATLAHWTVYSVDTNGLVFITSDLAAYIVRVVATEVFGGTTAAVFVVPKTVPARALSKVLGQDIPADGSRDIIVHAEPGETMALPMIFVDAIRHVDPRMAAQFEANAVANLS